MPPSLLLHGSPVVISAWVTFWAGSLALLVSLGIGWALAKHQFFGKTLVETFVMLPLVLPPTVLGFYLLIILGQRGLGAWLESALGVRIVFALPGAIVAASIAALPLCVQSIKTGLAEVDREIEESARVDGCTEWHLFWWISLPLAWRGLLAGATLGYLRALGEFGATLMVAGNIPGRTQTLPMAIYDTVQTNNMGKANGYVLGLTVVVSILLFVVMRLSQRRNNERM